MQTECTELAVLEMEQEPTTTPTLHYRFTTNKQAKFTSSPKIQKNKMNIARSKATTQAYAEDFLLRTSRRGVNTVSFGMCTFLWQWQKVIKIAKYMT